MQPDLFSPAFDYAVVDGIGRSAQRGRLPQLGGQTYRATAIGPTVELAHLQSAGGVADLLGSKWFDGSMFQQLLDQMVVRPEQWCASDGRQGMVSTAGIQCDDIVNSFKIDAHKAALQAGFRSTSALLVAAIGELIGNVVDHSDAPHSGIALFVAAPGQIEFVVADKGVGAMASLARNPDHVALSDEGSALQAMIENGVSRFPQGSGHGFGFRPIFEKLASMTGRLRFRSGDYALTLDGRFGDRIALQLAQKPPIHGVFASIVCRATPGPTSDKRGK